MQQMQNDADQNYLNTLLEMLKTSHETLCETQTEENLKTIAHAAMGRCELLGITDTKSIMWYAMAMIRVSTSFDNHPPILALLTDTTIPPEKRIEHLLQNTTDEDWLEASFYRQDT